MYTGLWRIGDLRRHNIFVGICLVACSIGITLHAVTGWFDFIHTQNVSQKELHQPAFAYYTNYMANVLPIDKQIAVVSSLCEGSSIRSIERVTGVHRDTIMPSWRAGRYAWIHATDDPAHPKRHDTVLHIPPVISAQTAVQAAIVQEFREHGKPAN
jgi:hypothetical protein